MEEIAAQPAPSGTHESFSETQESYVDVTEEVHRTPYGCEVVDVAGVDRRKDPAVVAGRMKKLAEYREKKQAGEVHVPEGKLAQYKMMGSALADSSVTEAALIDPEGLYNFNLPSNAIIHEKAEHRIILWMTAGGASPKEIAEKLGYHPNWVRQIRKQPWFQIKLTHELAEAGKDQIQERLRGVAPDLIENLIDIAFDENEKGAVKALVSNSLLDRFMGKATQRTELTVNPIRTKEVSELDVQIAEAAARVAALQEKVANARDISDEMSEANEETVRTPEEALT